MTTISTAHRSLAVRLRAGAWLLALSGLFGLFGCATPPAPPALPAGPQPFTEAAARAADSLVAQVQKAAPPRAGRAAERQGLLLDPMIDAGGAQQTEATARLQELVLARLPAQLQVLDRLPFQPENLLRARYLLTGTLARVAPDQDQSPLRIQLALTDLASGRIAAQATALARDEGLSHLPLPYDQDAPVPGRDRMTESYVRTSATAPGQSADPYYLDHIQVAPVIQEATALYNARHYEEALQRYSLAANVADSDPLRALNGVYLSAAKLGRTAEAEQAFGRIVAHGLANHQLEVKFLFNPGSTGFWSNPQISAPYGMWLREIARAGAGSDTCMDVIGHTSRTGSVAFNDQLSVQRARAVQQRLVRESPSLRERTEPSGRGFRENLIGSGTDDAIDALDRRVEFKVVDCR